MRSPSSDFREDVHHQLVELSLPGQGLDTDGRFSSKSMFGMGSGRWKRERAELHKRLLEPFRDGDSSLRDEGRCAIVTSGPPGVGKSTVVDQHLGGWEDWRRVDADGFKVVLVEHAVANGLEPYLELVELMLRDGLPVMPMELAALFHRESTYLAARATGLALRRGENVIVEGTLGWEGLVARYATQIAGAGYQELTVFDVSAPSEVAHERAKSRWWEGRLGDELGGRFTPPAAIDLLYDESGASICSVNARRLVAAAAELDVVAHLVETSNVTPPPPPEGAAVPEIA